MLIYITYIVDLLILLIIKSLSNQPTKINLIDKKILLDNLDENIINNPELLINKIKDEQISTISSIKFEIFEKLILHILHYYPNIKVNLFVSNLEKLKSFYLNYVTCIYAYDNNIKNKLLQLTYIKKPDIKVAKIITFGTFDLLHIGHENIFTKCNNLSSTVVIGVSSDELNTKKNKKAHDSIITRINNVKKYSKSEIVFKEESLEQKLEYIKKYDCNVLIMGNDWDNKFNSPEYESIYFNRTPNISSTQLRNQLNKIK